LVHLLGKNSCSIVKFMCPSVMVTSANVYILDVIQSGQTEQIPSCLWSTSQA
jgi:hypothetical protein